MVKKGLCGSAKGVIEVNLTEFYRIPREWKYTVVKKPNLIVCSWSKSLWTGVMEKTS